MPKSRNLEPLGATGSSEPRITPGRACQAAGLWMLPVAMVNHRMLGVLDSFQSSRIAKIVTSNDFG